MKERIQELAKQCYETGPIGKDGWPEYSKFNETKFAELIVKECANRASWAQDTGEKDIGSEVLKHFGVEE